MQPIRFPISLAFLLAVVLLGTGCRDPRESKRDGVKQTTRSPSQPEASSPSRPGRGAISDEMPSDEEKLKFVNQVRPQISAFCGDCHVMPRPSTYAREDWGEEVNQGFMLYATSGRTDLEIPPYDQVLKFFEYQAPESVDLMGSLQEHSKVPVPLRTSFVRLPGNRPPGVTNVRWMDIGLKDSKALVYCDIGSGAVTAHWPLLKETPTVRLATVFQPVHTEPCDLDDDGHIDLLVADIGEYNAEDSDLGRVVWLRRDPSSEKFETIVLQENLSRVADVQPGDFDGDGDQDVLVAVFGWRETGHTLLLENQLSNGDAAPGETVTGETGDPSRPQFVMREIDSRHGPIHVPPIDLNGDGHLDFVSLIAQDYEVVEAFLNDGTGQFTKEVLWQAPDPAYGSSGIQLVDLDQDGDQDVLYTNGDSFDRGPKRFHSIQWLENEGSYPFTHHHLCNMLGVLRAQAADFDGDGDLDIIACSALGAPYDKETEGADKCSVVMLVQTAPGEFEKTKVEGGAHHHMSLESGDFNGDGKTDFVVGTFLREGGEEPDLKIWWNESK